MKRLILFELILLFLSTTFISDNPPGWYQQTLPVNDQVNDIFFIDSLNGWVTTDGKTNPPDTGYIFKTIDGGNNWIILRQQTDRFDVVQFLDNSTGYCLLGWNTARVLKTSDGGINWTEVSNLGIGFYLTDMRFISKDTGWVCSDDVDFGRVWITTNGGLNWQQQLDQTYKPYKLFFINKDTGWVGTREPNGRLFRTTNGGLSWQPLYISNGPLESIFFLNGNYGWIRAGTTNGIQYSTNAGLNWSNAQGNIIGGYDIEFMNDSMGYSGTYSSFKILKSKDGGKNWGYQITPILSGNLVATLRNDTSNAWAGQIMHTADGGGVINALHQISNEIPSEFNLYQNYPNPFNPKTEIRYKVKGETSSVKLIVYDIQGREINVLVNEEQIAGAYEVDFEASGISSGVYLYSLIVDGIHIDTKRMVLLK